jgi:hypothetical protein
MGNNFSQESLCCKRRQKITKDEEQAKDQRSFSFFKVFTRTPKEDPKGVSSNENNSK